jgi:Fe-S-cluster containining protein
VISPLRFRCTACGNCCRTLRVAVTALDVRRLVHATGRDARELVGWLAPDAVDMSGEPDSFVELSEGRRLMVLRHRDGGCSLLGADNHCTAYAARPRDCRAFPFDFGPPQRASTPRRLELLPLDGCDYARDGAHEAAALELEDTSRWQELQQYQALVARWNRRAFHRRRLHKSVGSALGFLEFALASLPAPNESAESKTVP